MRQLFAQDYTVGEYIRLLQSLLSVIRPLETALSVTGRHMPGQTGYQLRNHELAVDLKILGAEQYVVDIHPPDALTLSAAVEMGSLYVLEGSRLGGRVIARQLSKTLKLTPGNGLRFFTGNAGTSSRRESILSHRRIVL